MMRASVEFRLTTGVISKKEHESLTVLHRTDFTLKIPLFEESKRSTWAKQTFVKIQWDGKDLFINKTTAAWLQQKNEHFIRPFVSSEE